MHPMLAIAIQAARQAGRLISRAYYQGKISQIDSKGNNDFVSEVDRQSEATIIELLQRAYPEHSILAEESGHHQGKSDYEWVIDPLDGTTNFLHNNPQFAVSIALRQQGRTELGVIYDPLRDELFTTLRGKGAFLNDRRIRVGNLTGLPGALLGTGFPFKTPHYLETYLSTFSALFPQVSDVRRAGAASLDLAYIAAGRLDGFWEMGLREWDVAAGALMIQEAGGLVSDFAGGHNFLISGNVVAGNPRLLKGILQTINPLLPPELLK
ncbi:MAG: inositol-1-monophosphatase [Thiotrichaceae bacterium]|nr:inositol-1-monophosphatase [Thiotrichaceae bacterium]